MARHSTLVFYTEAAISRMTATQLADSLDYAAPDVAVVPRPHHEFELDHADTTHDPAIHVLDSRRTQPAHYAHDGVDLVCLTGADDLADLPTLETDGTLTPETETYLLSDLLSIDIDPTRLTTELDGRDAYTDALPDSLSGSYTHLTTQANPAYRQTWDGLTVQGVQPGANARQGHTTPELAILTLTADGIVTTTTVGFDTFGIRAVSNVGETRAETLRDNGISSRADLTDTPVHELTELSGFGRKTAETVVESAEALEAGTVVRTGDEGFPEAEPIFIDIETDGLTPQMVWLIGVLDRTRDQPYRSFLARDPDRPGKAVRGFVSWLDSLSTNRPVVAYNGESFDFPVLSEHVDEHCPDSYGTWAETWTFDPYFWAVTQGNATLPGRTNKLDDVAEALGWETDTTGLDGATVGRLFQAYLANPCAATELDWERHETYCEDDVRALAHVFDAIADAKRTETDSADSQTTTTAQGTLTDF